MKISTIFAKRNSLYSFNSLQYYELYLTCYTARNRANSLADAFNLFVSCYYLDRVTATSEATYIHTYFREHNYHFFNGFFILCYNPITYEVIGVFYYSETPKNLFSHVL